MTNQRQLLASVIVFVALLAPAAAPIQLFGAGAQAQPADGKGPAEPKRVIIGGPDKSGPPSRPAPPTINRQPPSTDGRSERSNQVREFRPDRDGDRGRIILRDSDRRRDDGDRRRGTRYVWGPGLEFYFFDGFYHGDCSWLRRRARETGSSYWRRRYEQCRD